MDASRAATGMSEVLAIRTVRFIMDSPDLGSFSSGNSRSTSVIVLGTVKSIESGKHTVVDPIAKVETENGTVVEIPMLQNPDLGSFSSGNSRSTSVISLPRSPQPM